MKDYTIYVTEEIAKKAMEKGFECGIVTTAAFGEEPHCYNEFQVDRTLYRCPTAEQICGWLRYDENRADDKRIFISIETEVDNGNVCHYVLSIYSNNNYEYIYGYDDYSDYEDALFEAINKALDLI